MKKEAPTTTTFNYPANARQLPKHYSPLAAFMVAPGYVYDQQTGLVKPAQSSQK